MAAAELSETAVLVVDDNKAERALIVRALHALGVANLREAATRKEAISHLGRFKADVVLFDFTTDESEGVIFSRWVRTAPESANPFVPLIMIMAKPSVQEVKDALDAGINEILIKPISLKAMGDRIRAVLENPREFIRSDAYVGPDRRRRVRPDYVGPERRRHR
jgi:two-component system chemotaxis response regulator CheY